MKSIAFHLNCLEQGGAERVVSTLANEFAARGYKVYVAVEWIGKEEFPLDPRVEHVLVGPKPEDEDKGRITKIRLRISYLRQFLKKTRPDVLVAFTHGPNFRALQSGLGLHIPTVICVRINPVGWYDSKLDRLQIKFLFPKAAGAVFQTKEQRAFFAPLLQDNSTIIINPVNQKYLDVTPPAPEKRKKTVVQSSRLVDFKNQPMLLRAFVRVHAKHPDWELRLYGPDSGDGTKEKLERIIEENHAQDWIRLMGGSMHLEKDLADAGIFVLSSDYEGMPNALLEAMAMGLACIATDCPPGGPREVIQDGENGILVPVGEEKAMEEAIDLLIENPGKREKLGENARKIRKIASPDVIFSQWESYLSRVVENYRK